MMKQLFTFLIVTFGISHSLSAAEVFEISSSNFKNRPGGKEADSIIGDFVLRNDKIAAVISGNSHLRRPNMGGFYGDGNETPGCLYDLTRVGENNDQITIFTPCGQKGLVSYVKIAEKGKDLAAVETVTTSAKGNGIGRRHLYLLKDGWDGVLIVSSIRNDGEAEKEVNLQDGWTQMRSRGSLGGINWADAIDPADRCGYAYSWVEEEGASIPKGTKIKLAKGEEITVARFLAVGKSPAEALGIVAARKASENVAQIELDLSAKDQTSLARSRVGFTPDGSKNTIYGYPDNEGNLDLLLPAGKYKISVEDKGRDSIVDVWEGNAGDKLSKSLELGPRATVELKITDSSGDDIPVKVQFNPTSKTPKPELGPTDRAHGCVDQWHSATGSFQVPLPPGTYEVIVTRGPEYSHIAQFITLKPDENFLIEGQLQRQVDTSGWVSTDFHNHSTPSGDNTCGTDDRLINLAVEQIEFAPTTEHNRLYDWKPHIEKLGLQKFLCTIPGMELTGRGAHFNMFPLKPDPMKQDGGALVWQKDPRLNAVALRGFQGEDPDRWIHVNHPDMTENFIDRDKDGRADGGFAYFGKLIDGLESQNYRGANILAKAPFSVGKARTGLGKQVNYYREFIWLQLLNQGLQVWGIGVADAHHVYGNGVGSWRTYIPSTSDKPDEIDWREISRNAKAGRMILTTGPYLEVKTGGGIIAGGHDRVSQLLDLHVKVQCADWLDIDRVQVLVNGRQDERYNYTRASHPNLFKDGVVKFDENLELDLSEDAHIIVVAIGENSTLKKGFGSSSQSAYQPCAYNNPIFVDVDGGGFEPNYDTLGYDLPVGRLSPEKVEKLLGN